MHLLLHDDFSILDALRLRGVRVDKLSWCLAPGGWWEVPAQLAGLAQLRELSLSCVSISSGWQHLPQLEQLDLLRCGLEQVPAQLVGLTRLTELWLGDNDIEGGWQHLPRHLQRLLLQGCELQEVPAQLGSLAQLRELNLEGNHLEAG